MSMPEPSAASRCAMGFCPIPYECNGVGACFEASRAAERAYYEAQEADYYAEQEAEYHREMERAHREAGLRRG